MNRDYENKENVIIYDYVDNHMISMNKFSEKDWKIFRSKIAGWQEAYMDKLNKEYIEILSRDGKPSEKFWAFN